MTGDDLSRDPHLSGSGPSEPPPRVGASRGAIWLLAVVIIVVVFGLAAFIGYQVLGRSDSTGAFPTGAPATGVVPDTGSTSVVPTTASPTATTTTASRSSAPSSAPSSVPVTTADGAPFGSRACPILAGPTGLYRASSVGSSVTSCGFAEQVRQAYADSGRPGQLPRPIAATSPETGSQIEMMCAAKARIVTCTGGDDAVVYLY